MTDLPIIDLEPLRHGGEAGLAKVAAEVGAACRGVGFFYVVNHGVPAELTAQAFAKSRAFFAEPNEAKVEVAMEKSGGFVGYSGFGREALDPTRGFDIKESYNVGLDLAPDDPGLQTEPFRTLNIWPTTPGFRDVSLRYFDACLKLGVDLHRVFARDLGLADDHFDLALVRPTATLRLLRYPPERVGEIGAGQHTDYGNITLLAVDGVGGLEVRRRDGEWIAAPSIEGALIVNIGDCLMRWTNDIYVSTPHRVVSRGVGERYSMAFFLDPHPFANVEAIPSCVPPGASAKYAPILAHAYLLSRLKATYVTT